MRRSLSGALVLTLACGTSSFAVSPANLAAGRQLFERNWTMVNPEIGSDGLGPLFNARSCVACHHQGGVGGAGDSRFNALSLGIERMQFGLPLALDGAGEPASISNAARLELIRSFYPGFVQSNSIMNTAPLPHQGGSAEFALLRQGILSQSSMVRSDAGGPINASEVRSGNSDSIS